MNTDTKGNAGRTAEQVNEAVKFAKQIETGGWWPLWVVEILRDASSAYAAILSQQSERSEWPSDEDVIRAWSVLCESAEMAATTTGDKNMLNHMRAALQSVRPPAQAQQADVAVSGDPIGWVFQHEDTGRMCFCENDGINTPEVFAKNNPRHSLVSPAYASRHARQVPDVKAMVEQFLSWRLPNDFYPDGGISFTHATDPTWTHDSWPIGTNLFTADQAEAMIRHMLAASPKPGEG